MSTTEILFRSIEVALTLIGLVLVVFGWIIPYKNSILNLTITSARP